MAAHYPVHIGAVSITLLHSVPVVIKEAQSDSADEGFIPSATTIFSSYIQTDIQSKCLTSTLEVNAA